MDRKIEKKVWTKKRLSLISTLPLLVIFIVYQYLENSGSDRLRVDSTRLRTAEVTRGQFLDYYPFDAGVEPVTTVYMDVQEGGRVDEIYVEAGQYVERGEMILRISNPALQRSAITTETALLENLDRLSNTQFTRAQSKLTPVSYTHLTLPTTSRV